MLVQPSNPMAHCIRIILLLFFSLTNMQACNQAEHSSLRSLTLTLSFPPLNWTSTNCCHWEGITCNEDALVTHLILPSKGLKGGIFPSSLANLTHLTHLNLSHNSFYGLLEAELFSSLNHLEILDLSYNLLSGNLPLSLPSRHLRIIDLSSNHLHGAIPSSFIQQAWNLTSFNVSNNTFSESIPSSICLQHSSPFIRLLDFSFNQFSGSISPGLSRCSTLQIFRAGNNDLSGLLPRDIYNATKLEEFSLPSNSLSGGISDGIANLANLEILDLSFNHFSGVLPLHLGKLSKLKLMAFTFNNLQGSLPPSLMNCTNLREIHMALNNFEGDISMLNFPKLIHLSKLDLLRNRFTGTIPNGLYSCLSLKALRLSTNGLVGQIQPEILSLKSLSFLSLGGLTNITGAMKLLKGCKSLQTLVLEGSFKGEKIPTDIGSMDDFDGFQNLRFFILFRCEFTGGIPPWFQKLKHIEFLILMRTKISGPIPSWLGTLPKLFVLSLAENQLSGEFPKQLCALPRLVHEPTAADVDPYRLELPIFGIGVLDQTIVYPHMLVYFPPSIVLAGNNITGNIPTEIGQLHALHKLNLSNNSFSGNIPSQISDLKNLETLDLSKNGFSGTIPSALTGLTFLKFINVSYNNLEGEIPTSTQLQSFNASAFEGNLKLCGAPLPIECLQIKGLDEDKNSGGVDNGIGIPWFYVSVATGFIVGFLGVCGSLIKKNWRYAYFQFLDNIAYKIGCMRR